MNSYRFYSVHKKSAHSFNSHKRRLQHQCCVTPLIILPWEPWEPWGGRFHRHGNASASCCTAREVQACRPPVHNSLKQAQLIGTDLSLLVGTLLGPYNAHFLFLSGGRQTGSSAAIADSFPPLSRHLLPPRGRPLSAPRREQLWGYGLRCYVVDAILVLTNHNYSIYNIIPCCSSSGFQDRKQKQTQTQS